MNNIFRILSFSYLIFLSIILLIPLDFFLVTNFVPIEKQPNNNFSFIIHFVLFFILYLIFHFSFFNKFKILYFCIIYSVIIEFLQLFTLRGFQILDIVFNWIGVIIPYFLLYFLKNKKKIINKFQ